VNALYLAPHNDDEILWGTYSLLAEPERPHVVVCLRSVKQAALGISAQRREHETRAAMRVLGCEWEQGSEPDVNPDPDGLKTHMEQLDGVRMPERVYAPAVEGGGHDQHNLVGEIARDVFGDRVQPYLTYRRGHMRTRSENEVPYTTEMVALKLRALSCYRSQIGLRGVTEPWFMDDTLREYRP
jgi:LmbE family N-acetylglucosaminyl deacetylase